MKQITATRNGKLKLAVCGITISELINEEKPAAVTENAENAR